MNGQKTLSERQAELQALLVTPEGRDRLEVIADGYRYDRGEVRPPRSSVVTYIIVHERQLGLIAG